MAAWGSRGLRRGLVQSQTSVTSVLSKEHVRDIDIETLLDPLTSRTVVVVVPDIERTFSRASSTDLLNLLQNLETNLLNPSTDLKNLSPTGGWSEGSQERSQSRSLDDVE